MLKLLISQRHARSPAIQVIIGDEEVFLETETGDITMNVFFVNKSFLVEHLPYFANLLASPPSGDVVHLQIPEPLCTSDNTEGFRVFEDWLDALYQGTVERINAAPLKDFELSQRLDFADLVGSPCFKNLMMDTIQQRDIETWTVDQVDGLEMMPKSASMYVDYAIECVAYRVVTQGWTRVMDADLGVCVSRWKLFFQKARNMDTFTRLLSRIDKLHKAKDSHALINPAERKDCEWHEHTDEDREKCPRYQPKKKLGGVGVLFH